MTAVGMAAALMAVMLSTSTLAAERPEQPGAWFCMKARAHRALYPSDKAAEDAARAMGADEATIQKAHRCRRR